MNLRAIARWATTYVYPLLVLLISVPITTYAVARGVGWIGQVFPGFFVMENRVIPNVQGYDWLEGVRFAVLQQIVAIDGRAVESNREIYELVASRAEGTELEYTLRDGSAQRQVRVASRRFSSSDFAQTFGVLLLFGCASLITALIVAFLQPHTTEARVYLFSGFVAGLYPICGTLLYQVDAPRLLTTIYLIAEPLFPATWVHLALVFPLAAGAATSRRRVLLAAYGVSALLAAVLSIGFYSEPPNLLGAKLAWVYIAIAIVFFFGRMFLQSRNRDLRVQARARATFLWLLLATVPALTVFSLNAMPWRSVPQQFGLFLAPLFYFSIAYSIARHDLFDVNRLVRQSFAYGLLTLGVTVGYFSALAVPELVLGGEAQWLQRLFGIVFVLILAFTFNPLRRFAQALVDRAFYRTRLDYRATLGSVTAMMTTKLDVHDIVGAVTGVLTRDMLVERSALYLREGAVLWVRATQRDLEKRDAAAPLETLCELAGRHPDEWEARRLLAHEEDRHHTAQMEEELRHARIQVVLPLLFLGNPIGLLLLGGKLSGRTLEADDISLLRTLANQTAIALHNAASYAALEESRRTLDDKVQRQTKDLRESNVALQQTNQALAEAQRQLVQQEKMASLGQLVAGAAHELNNPVSHVHGSLENLQQYVQGFVDVLHAYEQVPIEDAEAAKRVADIRRQRRLDYLLQTTPTLLRLCLEGLDRIRHIVDDLRVFSRADHGAMHPLAVQEGVESALRLLEHRIRDTATQVQRDFSPVPDIQGRSDELNQVWTNLITNAIDAVAGRAHPEVRLRIAAYADGASGRVAAVEVSVADNGQGIPAEVREKIYDPFFTTKPIGAGTGLGLSIVHSIVRQHQGTIACDSSPGEGTTFTVRLPVPEPSL